VGSSCCEHGVMLIRASSVEIPICWLVHVNSMFPDPTSIMHFPFHRCDLKGVGMVASSWKAQGPSGLTFFCLLGCLVSRQVPGVFMVLIDNHYQFF
jgi:hypothetical protein